MPSRKRFAVVDCETDPFAINRVNVQPFIWGYYDGDEYHEDTNTKRFFEWLIKRDVIAYAHNGGKFDWHFFMEWLPPETRMMLIGSRLAKFKIGECEFRDSYSILPVPLSAYKKDEMDYSIMERDKRHKPANWKRIRDYLRADCVYTWEFIDRWRADHGNALTLASAAMAHWRTLSGEKSPETDSNFYQQFFPYYYGGRVEAFHKGEIRQPFQVIDINSAYPYAMQYRHPWGTVFDECDELPEDDETLRRCFIDVIAESRGAFPVRTGSGLDFPNDGLIREFHVTGHEFITARKWGLLGSHEVTRCIRFTDSIDFSGYVSHWFERKRSAKEHGDTAGYLIAKLMQNSLYGKFCANPERYKEYVAIRPFTGKDAAEVARWSDYDWHGNIGPQWLIARQLPEHKQRYFNVATGASITGFVRAFLLDAMLRCTNVMYCDTDSIVCTAHRLDIGDKLGQWDVEARCDFGAIAGKKLYAFDTGDGWKTATKGVRLSPDEIIRVANGEAIEYCSLAPTYRLGHAPRQIRRLVKST